MSDPDVVVAPRGTKYKSPSGGRDDFVADFAHLCDERTRLEAELQVVPAESPRWNELKVDLQELVALIAASVGG